MVCVFNFESDDTVPRASYLFVRDVWMAKGMLAADRYDPPRKRSHDRFIRFVQSMVPATLNVFDSKNISRAPLSNDNERHSFKLYYNTLFFKSSPILAIVATLFGLFQRRTGTPLN